VEGIYIVDGRKKRKVKKKKIVQQGEQIDINKVKKVPGVDIDREMESIA